MCDFVSLCDIVTRVNRCEYDIHCGMIISSVCIESILSKPYSLTQPPSL